MATSLSTAAGLLALCLMLPSRPALGAPSSILLYHWGQSNPANAQYLWKAGYQYRPGIDDAHFRELNGASCQVRNGRVCDDFMAHVFRFASRAAKDGAGFYTSRDPFRWMGWGGAGYDLLVVEVKGASLQELQRRGILSITADNQAIRRAPTPEETRQGIELLIRPPTAADVARIWDESGDKAAFLDRLVTTERRMGGLDLRTPIVKEVFRRLIHEHGREFQLSHTSSGRR